MNEKVFDVLRLILTCFVLTDKAGRETLWTMFRLTVDRYSIKSESCNDAIIEMALGCLDFRTDVDEIAKDLSTFMNAAFMKAIDERLEELSHESNDVG